MTDNESFMCGNEFDAVAQKNVQKTFRKPLTVALLFVTMGSHTEKDRAKYMRTKALLAGALIGAASLATSMAQVYSVNIVGYVNTTLAPGFNMVQNPLNNPAGNSLGNIMPTFSGSASYIRLYRWDSTQTKYLVDTWTRSDGSWDDGTMVLNPGDGYYLYNPSTSPVTLTFVGEVATGNLTNTVYKGFTMVGSQVPQQDTISALGYAPSSNFERVYAWNTTAKRYDVYTYTPADGWDPEEPVLNVGQSVYLYRTGANSVWTRTFNVQ